MTMTYTDADWFLVLLRDNPTLMHPADGCCDAQAMDHRVCDQVHACLKCGQRARTALVADTSIGPRWIDLCLEHYDWLSRNATKTGAS